MVEAVLEKAVCAACGVDVRDGTQFCFNCGKPVSNGVVPAAANVDEAVLSDELVSELSPGSAEDAEKDEKAEKLAVAAAERKKSRLGQRKPKKVVWEEPSPASNRIFILVSLLITVVAAALVFLMVFVK